ncbi:MAG: NAD(P)-dependent oxidoreductase [Spirochaetales bacterium]|nr:NAD(P)-dependent oxidoreductase [Spirochaetales bacterium]
MNTTRIGFIGTGVMGGSMAGRLLDAGYPLFVYTRTREKSQPLLERGAAWRDSPGAVAADSTVLITMVGYPSDVEEVYLGPDGVLAKAHKGCLLIDMTTSRPDLARRIAREAARKSCMAIDAPVSGGDTGARNGTLSIMAGGDEQSFTRALPVLQHLGTNIVFQGGPGAGQYCKMCNQIAIAATMVGVCESLAYAEAAGLEPRRVLESISRGAAGSWSLSNLAPRILDGDFTPGFFVKHFIKDMGIALESADALGLPLPGLMLAKDLYEKLAAKGLGDAGTQGLYRLYKDTD